MSKMLAKFFTFFMKKFKALASVRRREGKEIITRYSYDSLTGEPIVERLPG